MKVQLAKLALAILMLLSLPACGVFQVGLESPTPKAVTPLPPTNPPPPSDTVPAPTITPFPNQLKPGQPVRITHIQMLNKTNGWGIGQVETDQNDHILFTLNGGHSWQDRTPPEAFLKPSANGLAATSYFGADGNAWVAYAGQMPQQPVPAKQVLWHTQDYGQTWEIGGNLELAGLQSEYFLPSTLNFLDAQQGWLMAHVGAGMSHDYIVGFATTNGGQSWQRIIDPEKNPDLMSCPKTGLAFSTLTNGWLTGNCPGLMNHLFFYATTDGGQTWQQASLLSPANQPVELFSNGKAGCGLPDFLSANSRLIRLTVRCEFYDAKRTLAWLYAGQTGGSLVAHPLPLPYGAIQFIDGNEGWLVGTQQNDPAAPGAIYHTTDGGQTWTLVIATAWQGTPDFIDSTNGWVVARAADKLALVHTLNGGVLWEQISPVIGK